LRSANQEYVLNGRNPILLASLKPGVRSSASLANFNFNLTTVASP